MDPNLAALLGIAFIALLAFLASQRERQPRQPSQNNCQGRCGCLAQAHVDAIGAGAANAKANDALEATLRMNNALGHLRGQVVALQNASRSHSSQLRSHNTRIHSLFNAGGNVFSWVPIIIGAAVGFFVWLIARIVIESSVFEANGLDGRQFRLSEVWNLHIYSAILLGVLLLSGALAGSVFAFRRDNTNQPAQQSSRAGH